MHNFHEDPRLPDLLSPERQQHLLRLLQQLAGSEIVLLEAAGPGAEPVEFNLETLAWLQAPARAQAQAAARLLEFILFFVGKYRLAANLHRDTTEASFAELQQQNAALRVSEERYRGLSQQLQQRVEAQVQVIEQTQQQLYESARLRAIGQLAAGVAHEINNPVGFITSNLRVAADYLEELATLLPAADDSAALLQDFRALVEESMSGARRIAAIVADLKTFSNIDRSDFMPCDLRQLLRAACNLLQAENGQQLALDFDCDELPHINGFPARLSQAFFNVLDNAAKALRERDGDGCIRVRGREVQGRIEIAIEDNGGGMDEEVQARVFEPFFSTRGVGGGTGLGLTVARDIVLAHQGEICLVSQAGRGTCVSLRFPLP